MSELLRVASSTDRDAWLTARAGGVSASEVHTIAHGGRSTWMRVLADKLNGETFRGTDATARGRDREAFILAILSATVAPLTPNSDLFADPTEPRFTATPDGLGDASPFGVEVKSHDYGWDREDVPAEHYDQCQWGMAVTGYDGWLYAWEVMGEDGEPTLAPPTYVWIRRDELRIGQLRRAAHRFLTWWDEGAPAVDDIPDEVDDALARFADARERKKAAEADEKVALDIIRAHAVAHLAAHPDDNRVSLAGNAAQFTYAATETTTTVLDRDAWAAAEPYSAAAAADLTARVKATEEAALALYFKTTTKVATRLVVTPNPEQEK